MTTVSSSWWALQALIVIALEKHRGTWVSLGWLAGEIKAPRAMTLAACELLAGRHEISRGELPMVGDLAEPVFGVDVAAHKPPEGILE